LKVNSYGPKSKIVPRSFISKERKIAISNDTEFDDQRSYLIRISKTETGPSEVESPPADGPKRKETARVEVRRAEHL
jgi:hypothetical protein